LSEIFVIFVAYVAPRGRQLIGFQRSKEGILGQVCLNGARINELHKPLDSSKKFVLVLVCRCDFCAHKKPPASTHCRDMTNYWSFDRAWQQRISCTTERLTLGSPFSPQLCRSGAHKALTYRQIDAGPVPARRKIEDRDASNPFSLVMFRESSAEGGANLRLKANHQHFDAHLVGEPPTAYKAIQAEFRNAFNRGSQQLPA
jgi:hypothetical protein